MKTIVLVILLGLNLTVFGQKNKCDVDLEAISGTYEGDCRRGNAHGVGTAQGEDTYKGEFKRGLPHGVGTYTWKNGDVYVGEFNRGEKDGEGKMTVKTKADTDSTYTGYWSSDEYIGEDKYPYKVLTSDANIVNIEFIRVSEDGNNININYRKAGQPVKHADVTLTNMEGNFASIISNPYKKTVNNVNFPFRAIVQGGGERWEFRISQSGTWNITVNLIDR